VRCAAHARVSGPRLCSLFLCSLFFVLGVLFDCLRPQLSLSACLSFWALHLGPIPRTCGYGLHRWTPGQAYSRAQVCRDLPALTRLASAGRKWRGAGVCAAELAKLCCLFSPGSSLHLHAASFACQAAALALWRSASSRHHKPPPPPWFSAGEATSPARGIRGCAPKPGYVFSFPFYAVAAQAMAKSLLPTTLCGGLRRNPTRTHAARSRALASRPCAACVEVRPGCSQTLMPSNSISAAGLTRDVVVCLCSHCCARHGCLPPGSLPLWLLLCSLRCCLAPRRPRTLLDSDSLCAYVALRT